MTKERADLGFADALDDFNPAEWKPKKTEKPRKEDTAQAAQAAGFKSREVIKSPSNDTGQGSQRRYRTGRNAQMNLKARPETIEAYNAIADSQGWSLSETLEHAVALLEANYSVK